MNRQQEINVTHLHADIRAIAANPEIASEFNYYKFSTCFVGLAVKHGSFGNTAKYGDYGDGYCGFMDRNFGADFSKNVLWDNDILRHMETGSVGLAKAIPILEKYMKQYGITPLSFAVSPVTPDLREQLQKDTDKAKAVLDKALADSLEVLNAIEQWQQAQQNAAAVIAKFKATASESATPELYATVLNQIPSLSAKARGTPKRKAK